MRFVDRFSLAFAFGMFTIATLAHAGTATADVVVMDAKIYTADLHRHTAQALAVGDGKIIYVGTNAAAEKFIGPHTKIEQLGGKLVLPGLIDAHIHSMGIVRLDTCDLNSQPKTLAEITEFVRACIERYQVKNGEWLTVQQWDFSTGNQPDAERQTSTCRPRSRLHNHSHSALRQ